MARTVETVATIPCASGTMTIQVDRSVSAPTVPDYASVRPMSEFAEQVDVLPGDRRIQEISFEYFDSELGYWHTVLAATDTYILALWTEDGTTTRLFKGLVQNDTVEIEEYDRSSYALALGAYGRRGKFQCIESIVALRDIATADIAAACAPDMISLTDPLYFKIMPVKRFLVRIMEQINGSVDDDDVNVSGVTFPIQFSADNVAWYEWYDLYFWCGTQDAGMLKAGWFADDEWPAAYPEAFSVLSGICRSLLMEPIIYYDSAASRYRMAPMARGWAGPTAISSTLTMGTVLESLPHPNINRNARGIVVRSAWSDASTNALGVCGYSKASDTYSYVAQPVNVDIDYTVFWMGNDAYNAIENLMLYVSGTTAELCKYVRVYDHYLGAWTQMAYGSGDLGLALITLYLNKMFNRNRVGVDKTYTGIGHPVYLHALSPITEAAGALYATEIYRDPPNNSVRVVWEQV